MSRGKEYPKKTNPVSTITSLGWIMPSPLASLYV